MSAVAEELSGEELETGARLFGRRQPGAGADPRVDARRHACHPRRTVSTGASVSQHWVLDPDSSPDARAEVTL